MGTFQDLNSLPHQDPYHGIYDKVMLAFAVPVTGAGWNKDRVFDCELMVNNLTNVYVGIFEDPSHLARLTRLIHDPQRYPAVIGHASP